MPLRGEIAVTESNSSDLEAESADAANVHPADGRGSIWWLIGAAALIGLGLVWILLRGA